MTRIEQTVTVVIRFSGERTYQRCQRIIESQVSRDDIVVISDAPFETTLRRTYEIGIERNKPWTFAVDADVLLCGNAIEQLIDIAEQLDPNVFEIQGQVIDKLAGGFRPAGQHLYRTALLPKAKNCIPRNGSEKRPEGYTLRNMESKGFPFLETQQVFGLHDYEQWYRDIYRKAYFHAHKFSSALPYWAPLWEKMAPNDSDFKVALIGLRDGQTSNGNVGSDIRRFPGQRVDQILQKRGFREKPMLAPRAGTGDDVDRFVDTFSPFSEYWAWMSRSRPIDNSESLIDRFRSGLKRIGWAKFMPWAVGGLLSALGHKLQDWAKH